MLYLYPPYYCVNVEQFLPQLQTWSVATNFFRESFHVTWASEKVRPNYSKQSKRANRGRKVNHIFHFFVFRSVFGSKL
jgi:hypothetical protein